MSIDFYGKTEAGGFVSLPHDHRAALNMSYGNASVVLGLFGLEIVDGYGEAPVSRLREGLVTARAKLPTLTERERYGRSCDYLEMRLEDLSRCIDALVALGAHTIYWA
jgi:hypothetical protein